MQYNALHNCHEVHIAQFSSEKNQMWVLQFWHKQIIFKKINNIYTRFLLLSSPTFPFRGKWGDSVDNRKFEQSMNYFCVYKFIRKIIEFTFDHEVCMIK